MEKYKCFNRKSARWTGQSCYSGPLAAELCKLSARLGGYFAFYLDIFVMSVE